tara:strand:- start:14168 stop:14761 length:594 start_codon:yes stop_codon:yes gene_type:complete
MKKEQRQKIQITLIFIGLFLILVTYFYYPYMNKSKIIENQKVEKIQEDQLKTDESTSFEDVEYKGLYDFDKPFTVKSQTAHILNENPDVVHMNKMHVILYLSDGRIVNITSNKGRYNKITYDCFFEEEVFATDGETQILAKNLDLLATKNSVEIYNSVILNYPTGSLEADKIDYDFETKFFKVSMFEDELIKMKVIK